MSLQKISVALILAGATAGHAALAAQPIVGSWYTDLPGNHSVTTLLEDGTYFHAVDVTGDGTHTGVEWGTFSWDAVSGKVSATALGNTNGDWGFADDVDGPMYVAISGNTATVSQPGCGPSCTVQVERILHTAGSIVGTWLLPDGPGTVTFFADGSYILGSSADGTPGMERGTYSWDSQTGKLMATSILTDTNGQAGLSHVAGGFLTASFAVNGDLLVAEQGQAPGLLTAAPVPEADTWAMMFAGLGLVGWSAMRRRRMA